MKVIIIEESRFRTPEQAKILFGSSLFDYFHKNMIRYYVVDKDILNGDSKPPDPFARILIHITNKKLPFVVVVDDNDTIISEFELPLDENILISKIEELNKPCI